MAQIFKSKELTFSIPEKEIGEHTVAPCGVTYATIYTQTCICTHHTPHPTWCTWSTCICTLHSPIIDFSPYVNVCTFDTRPILTQTTACGGSETPWLPQEISEIKDAEKLALLKDELSKAMVDVEKRLKEIKTK
jgi:hypothetical protein